jgi:hypothetical protein
MDLLSRRDLIKPHIAELRQQSRRAQAVRQAREPQTRQRRYKARRLKAPAPVRQVLAALGLRSP